MSWPKGGISLDDLNDPQRLEELYRAVEERQKLRSVPSRLDDQARLREEVFKRDGWRCRWCGRRGHLSVDHIHPRSRGGSDNLDNLQTLCRSCNSRKGTSTMVRVKTLRCDHCGQDRVFWCVRSYQLPGIDEPVRLCYGCWDEL